MWYLWVGIGVFVLSIMVGAFLTGLDQGDNEPTDDDVPYPVLVGFFSLISGIAWPGWVIIIAITIVAALFYFPYKWFNDLGKSVTREQKARSVEGKS